jgi:hypothetical protein
MGKMAIHGLWCKRCRSAPPSQAFWGDANVHRDWVGHRRFGLERPLFLIQHSTVKGILVDSPRVELDALLPTSLNRAFNRRIMKTRITSMVIVPVALASLFACAGSLGADTLLPPTASTSQEASFEVTTVTRVNGCRMVLRRSTKATPALKGYWSQEVSVLDHPLLKMTWLASFGERSLRVEHDPGYTVMQVDGSVNGRYEMFLVCSSLNQKLIDVLLVTPAGWLRHGTAAEFSAGEAVLDHLRRSKQEIKGGDDKAIREVWDNMKGSLTKPK